MTKEELSQLRHLKNEAEMIRVKLENVAMAKDSVKASSRDFPWTIGRVIISGRDEKKIDWLEARYNKKLYAIDRELDELNAYIDSVGDSLVRQLLTYRYIDCLSWRDIEAIMGHMYTADYLRITLSNYLKVN